MGGKWYYIGDVDFEGHGGVFYKIDPDDLRFGYAEAVRVEPLGDAAGADGLVLIESLSIPFPECLDRGEYHEFDFLDVADSALASVGDESAETRLALKYIAAKLAGEILENDGELTPDEINIVLRTLDAIRGYGGYDTEDTVVLRIPEEGVDELQFASWEQWYSEDEQELLEKDYGSNLTRYILDEWVEEKPEEIDGLPKWSIERYYENEKGDPK